MARKRKRRHTYKSLRKRYGRSFAEDVRGIGAKLHRLAQNHPTATAALTGASVGAVAGGMPIGAAAALGGTAALVAESATHRGGK
jgi:hypothetical protein